MEELSCHILDLARNSLEAGATGLEITITENPEENLLEFQVRDNGRGIDEKDIPRLMDPFFTTKQCKKVGLGIPLLLHAIKTCGGTLKIKPLPEKGTEVTACFPYHHLDRAPLGDLPGTLSVLLTAENYVDLLYRHKYKQDTFIFDTKELRSQLGEVPLKNPVVLTWLQNYLNNELNNLRGGKTIENVGRTGQFTGKTSGRHENPRKK
ncbi:ATP-binding protein [Desulfolucanica intricata]|uniref:ATP-binding protein n=1 Tax=Desulfolucanica intricata TaxID=1285191 RepID=UPI0009EEE3EF|nr:ATP-binding protein [Desulfolucanica intricata]